MKTLPDTLRQMATVIEERGWCQKDYVDDDGCVCTIGALGVVMFADAEALRYSGDRLRAERVIRPLAVFLGSCGCGGCECNEDCDWSAESAFEAVGEWNDDPITTELDVLRTLRRAADHFAAVAS